jgi:hypothetical protein
MMPSTWLPSRIGTAHRRADRLPVGDLRVVPALGVTDVLQRPHRPPRLQHPGREAGSLPHAEGGVVDAVHAGPEAKDHGVGARLAQRDADHVAAAQLAGAFGHALEHGVEVQRGVDLVGEAAEHVGLVPAPLGDAALEALFVLPPGLLGPPALRGQALQRLDAQTEALVFDRQLSSRMGGRRLHDGL